MKTKPILMRRWWRVLLLLLLCLFGGTVIARAGLSGNKWKENCVITQQPTPEHPYITVEFVYYDYTSGSNGFLTHKKRWVPKDGGGWVEAKGPAIFVDGKYVGSVDNEVSWPGGAENGNGSGAAGITDYDSWYGNTYSKTYNGVKYQVRFYDPRKATSVLYKIRMCVYIGQLRVGSTHTVEIRCTWKVNNDQSYDIEHTMTTAAVPSPWGDSPTATMTDYDHVSVSGPLNKSYGPTTVGILQADQGSVSTSKGYVAPGNLAASVNPSKGQTSFSGLSYSHNRSADQQADGSTVALEYIASTTADDFGTTFYEWKNVSVPGFVVPDSLTSHPDQWTKSVTIKWAKNEANGRSKQGSWSVFRDGNLYASGLNYSTDSCQVSVPKYGTANKYKVVFVPKSSPSGTYISKLSSEISASVNIDWSISNFKGTLVGDDAIKLTWNHPAIIDASSSKKYTLKLQRRDNSDADPKWEDVANIDITSPDTEEGSYTDNKDLRAKHSYSYRLSISLFETTISTKESDFNPVTIGGSKITAFSASRGIYSNVVKLSWTVKQVGVDVTEFVLYRRPLGSTNEDEWMKLDDMSGTATNYSYNDESVQAGNYNQYKIAIVGTNASTGKQVIYDSRLTDGFTFASGVVSGRVTYGTGAGVEGAKVTLKPQNGDGELTQNGGMHSLRFKGSRYTGMRYLTDTTTIRQLFGGDFTMQMYVNPAYAEMAAHNTKYITFDSYNVFSFYLRTDTLRKQFEVLPWVQGYKSTGIYIPGNEWSHVTIVYKSSIDSLRVVVHRADTTMTKDVLGGFAWSANGKRSYSIAVGNGSNMNAANNFRGFIDEVRFFTKALTDTEIERNYNHPLSGNETGLALYYPMDEGIASQTIAYDFSRTNGIANGRHAESGDVPAYTTDNLPSDDQLSLMDYTDVNGNYTVRGVPYSGEGTTYSIMPKKGIHVFSPTSQTRFVSTSSLVHNGVDFTDISSFPVSGKIFYAGTDYPVEGVNFYVDGIACTRGGELITTAADGSYTISVPIGEHYISVAKNGHVFANDGRYPADPFKTDTCATFIQEVKNLDFQDETLVNFSGRVVGGDIEGNKPLGFGASENNIGVTELVLTAINTTPRLNVIKVKDETSYSYEANPEDLPIPSATEDINSTSWRGKGDANCQRIFIQTDSVTGEFSAMLPPIQYKISSMTVKTHCMKATRPRHIPITRA